MPTNIPGGPQPEYLGPAGPGTDPEEPPASSKGRRRTGVVFGVVVAVVAALGVGGYGLAQLMSGGESPASAVPADALGYLSLDLDPSAAQKIEAFKIMRKFPSLRKELGSRDDLRRAAFQQILQESPDCSSLSYGDDIEPWIGNRIAVAAVPDDRRVAVPLVVLQVTDEAAAKKGITALQDCSSDTGSLAISFSGDYALMSEKQADVDRIVKDVETASLADDADYQKWMDRLGDPGFVTMYASKDAPDAISRAERKAVHEYGAGADPFGDVDSLFEGFEGAAGVVRFEDGAVEAQLATKGLRQPAGSGDTAGRQAQTLPATTAVALSVAFEDGWLSGQLDQLRRMTGDDGSFDQMLREAERMTGLRLPEDVETMLGDGLTVSLDSSADLQEILSSPDPTRVPAGIRISGDPTKIKPLIDKLIRSVGPEARVAHVESGDGVVVVGLDPGYVRTLLHQGTLGDEESFRRVVPQADHAGGLFYVDFDAGDGWAERLTDLVSDGDAGDKAAIAPLDALGVSGWVDGDGVQRAMVKLTTD